MPLPVLTEKPASPVGALPSGASLVGASQVGAALAMTPAQPPPAAVTPALPAVDTQKPEPAARPRPEAPSQPVVTASVITPPVVAAPQIASVLDDPLATVVQQAVTKAADAKPAADTKAAGTKPADTKPAAGTKPAGTEFSDRDSSGPILSGAAARTSKPAPKIVSDVPDAPFIEVQDRIRDAPTAAFASRRADGAPPPLGMAASFSIPKPGKPAPDLPQLRPSVVRPATATVSRPLGGSPVRPTVAAAKSAAVTAAGIPSGRARKPKPVPIAAATPAPTGATAKSGSTTMGSFGSRQLPQRGKPRYLGLILTAALLLFLALVAAWSSFYITSRSVPAETGLSGDPVLSGSADTAAVDAATIAAPDGAAPSGQTVPDVEDEMLADLQDPDQLAADAGDSTNDLTTDLTADQAGLAAALPAAAPVPAVAAAPPALGDATTQAPSVAPQSEAQDEIFLAAMDSPPRQLDALALPLPISAPDAVPAAQLPPPPFGTVYQFDADGSIIATPEGIITPEGVTLVSGRPAKVPPARPAALAGAPVAVATATDALPPTAGAIAANVVPDATVATAAPFLSDPALAAARPRARPETLVPPSALSEDDAALPVSGSVRLTSRRPEARPASVFARAEEARLATESASLVLASAAGVADQASVSPLAIDVSRKPAARPKDFSKAIDAAVAAAVRQPDTPNVPDARVEPEAEDEPEVVADAAPKIPTRASVAKQATFVNAINLSKTNLIGVYGTSSKRYALVRQSNGRYRKVSVGDKVDGGTVAAINASELRYKKGNKMITLAMPKG